MTYLLLTAIVIAWRGFGAQWEKGKGKTDHLYSTLHGIQTTLKRSGMDHTVYLQ